MASFFDLFRRGVTNDTASDEIIENLNYVKEEKQEEIIREQVEIREDNRSGDFLGGEIQSVITESKASYSPDTLAKMLGEDEGRNSRTDQFLTALRADMNLSETFLENEEMSRDSVIGSAMEIIADDSCQRDERSGLIVNIESEDAQLEKFLEDFLLNNVKVDDRIWTWTYEVVKHGDFKLRRREYYAGSDKTGIKNVYYEDVLNPYLVSRIEYMGNVIGYEDEDIDSDYDVVTSDPSYGNGVTGVGGQAKFERADEFVHFMSSKLSKRIKVRINVKDKDDKLETITCYKVVGTSIVDNVRYIYRIINMLDNMLVLSRLARSTQYNLVKVEVGNASSGKTQQILMDVRRRIEGSTKLRKGVGIQSDPSPIPINSNVYLPTREGRGDVTVDPVGDNVDVRAIVDIDYFRDKEFAALKIPKQYLGFEESLSTLGNNSLARMDIRYARSVQRVQNILNNGVRELCNNYLRYRGRNSDVNKFKVVMRPISTAESAERIEDWMMAAQAFDAGAGMLQEYAPYIDKAKFLRSMLGLIGLSPSEIGNEEFLNILKEIEDGTYKEANHKVAQPEEQNQGW